MDGMSHLWGGAVVVDESGEARDDKRARETCFSGSPAVVERPNARQMRDRWQNRSNSSKTSSSSVR